MKVSYAWLQTYFDTPLPEPQKLADLFSIHVCEVEGVEASGNDTVLDVKILPDRAHYMLSHKGVAREASLITGIALKNPEHKDIAVDNSIERVQVSIENSALCRRYIAREIRNLQIGQSPAWLTERLETIGQRSINAVVDATNYVMLDSGQPLHAFDADNVKGALRIRNARPDETITLLSGQDIALMPDDLIIADDEGPLAIAGVKGGKRAEVTRDTKRIIVESANFDPTAVRKTATRLNLRNDSSKRFENEITPALAEAAMAEISGLIAECIPSAAIGPVTDIYPTPVAPWNVVTTAAHISSVIGTQVSDEQAIDILERMGCVVKKRQQ